jgi:hypothetical protein
VHAVEDHAARVVELALGLGGEELGGKRALDQNLGRDRVLGQRSIHLAVLGGVVGEDGE